MSDNLGNGGSGFDEVVCDVGDEVGSLCWLDLQKKAAGSIHYESFPCAVEGSQRTNSGIRRREFRAATSSRLSKPPRG